MDLPPEGGGGGGGERFITRVLWYSKFPHKSYILILSLNKERYLSN